MDVYDEIRGFILNSGVFEGNYFGEVIFTINVYFVAMGVRNAYIPEFDEINKHSIYKLMLKIQKINGVKVVFGHYNDTDVHKNYVIYNKQNEIYTDEILGRLDRIERKSMNPEVHILLGKLLSYTCPINLIEYLEEEKQLYLIKYLAVGSHDTCTIMQFYCPTNINIGPKEFELLNKMNIAIELLNINIKITLEAEIILP